MSIEESINNICNDVLKSGKSAEKCSVMASDQTKKTPTRSGRGRKNKGLTELHRQEYNSSKLEEWHKFKSIEHCKGEIVNTDDLIQFKELYQTTCTDILTEFIANNEELAKKHPNMWYKRLLIEIRRNTPKVNADDLNKLIIIWDCLRDLLNYIGLYMTYEVFRKVTDIEKKLLENRTELSPKYNDFLQKIYNDCKDDLQAEIYYSPLNSVNKIYLNKSVYGVIEKTEQKTIEVNHNIRNYNNLPIL